MLVDEKDLPWDQAWKMTQAACAYTNHTLMPEALEKWPVGLLGRVLPRHLQIIYEINRRFLAAWRRIAGRWARSDEHVAHRERQERKVRMANLAIVGSHSVNGVAALHSQLVKTRLVPDFYALWPEIQQQDQRCYPPAMAGLRNPALAGLITRSIGESGLRLSRSAARSPRQRGGISAGILRHKAGKQNPAGHGHPRNRGGGRSKFVVRRSGQATA